MAITGKAYGPTPARLGAGFPQLFDVGEATSQTYTLGALVFINTSGVLQEIATDGSLLYGVASKAGQNVATDGAKNAKVYKITPGALFSCALSVASWNKSFIGVSVGLSKSASTYVADTAYTSVVKHAVIVGLDGDNFTTGDSTPSVLISFMNLKIQGEV